MLLLCFQTNIPSQPPSRSQKMDRIRCMCRSCMNTITLHTAPCRSLPIFLSGRDCYKSFYFSLPINSYNRNYSTTRRDNSNSPGKSLFRLPMKSICWKLVLARVSMPYSPCWKRKKNGINVLYQSLERYPISVEAAQKLNYPAMLNRFEKAEEEKLNAFEQSKKKTTSRLISETVPLSNYSFSSIHHPGRK